MTVNGPQCRNGLQFLIFVFLKYFSWEGLAVLVAYRKAGDPDPGN